MTVYAETLIGSVTVGAGGQPTIEFTNIPSTYTDLVLKVSGRLATNDNYYNLRINGSTQTLSVRTVRGSGSATTSESWSSTYLGIAERADSTANTFGSTEYYIPNYTSSKYKSISVDSVTENNATAAFAELASGLWSSTSAITALGISNIAGGNLAQYTTAYLYGITGYAETGATSKATGGVVTSDATYYYHTFNSTGTFTPLQSLTVDYLVVAGGGGGGGYYGGGGGGAGGLRSSVSPTGGGASAEASLSLTANTKYGVIVGAGSPGTNGSNGVGFNGTSSSFHSITATGGGGGGSHVSGLVNGVSGGSGGGGSRCANPAASGTGGAGTSSQGYAGGNGYNTNGNGGGGGGGAGAVGANASGPGGNGGNGVSNAINGTATYYAGGGGGGSESSTKGNGGLGGGGNGGAGASPLAVAGTANTGGGGGGGGGGLAGGAGGSGIVIIRYAK